MTAKEAQTKYRVADKNVHSVYTKTVWFPHFSKICSLTAVHNYCITMKIYLAVSTQYTHVTVTDRQTDGLHRNKMHSR